LGFRSRHGAHDGSLQLVHDFHNGLEVCLVVFSRAERELQLIFPFFVLLLLAPEPSSGRRPTTPTTKELLELSMRLSTMRLSRCDPSISVRTLTSPVASASDHPACPMQHFTNEKYEVKQYDKTLQGYEKASVKIATSLSLLNSGQNVIFSSALTVMMGLAAQGILKGQSSFPHRSLPSQVPC
jgi:hypothetical protein